MITRGHISQKSNFEDFILPNKISRIQELSGGFPLELPWINWGPQGPLPTTDTPSNFKSWIFPNLVNLSYHIVTIALRKKLWSTSVICQPNIYSDLLATIQQTIPQSWAKIPPPPPSWCYSLDGVVRLSDLKQVLTFPFHITKLAWVYSLHSHLQTRILNI